MDRRTLIARSLTGAAAAGALVAAPAGAATRRRAVNGMVVEAVQLPAWVNVQGAQGARRPLRPGDTVSSSQEVQTAPAAGLVLRLPEGSLVRLGANTRLGIQRLEVNSAGGRTGVKSQLKLFDGFMRFATSVVAQVLGSREIDVAVRTATIGIRGTDFWTMTDEKHDAACLFEGKVDLATRDQGALVLDKPTAFWARFFDQPIKPVGNATPDELNKFLKTTEVQPGQGVAVVGGQWRAVALSATSIRPAALLAQRLKELGYPADVKTVQASGARRYEVRISDLGSRSDAEAIVQKISGVSGVAQPTVQVG